MVDHGGGGFGVAGGKSEAAHRAFVRGGCDGTSRACGGSPAADGQPRTRPVRYDYRDPTSPYGGRDPTCPLRLPG